MIADVGPGVRDQTACILCGRKSVHNECTTCGVRLCVKRHGDEAACVEVYHDPEVDIEDHYNWSRVLSRRSSAASEGHPDEDQDDDDDDEHDYDDDQ